MRFFGWKFNIPMGITSRNHPWLKQLQVNPSNIRVTRFRRVLKGSRPGRWSPMTSRGSASWWWKLMVCLWIRNHTDTDVFLELVCLANCPIKLHFISTLITSHHSTYGYGYASKLKPHRGTEFFFVCHCGTFPEVKIFRRALGSISNAKVVYINRLIHLFPGP